MPKKTTTTIVDDYLSERGGNVFGYYAGLDAGWRIGQAFFNALSKVDQNRINGLMVDPFYKDDIVGVEEAIEWLLDTEPRNKE